MNDIELRNEVGTHAAEISERFSAPVTIEKVGRDWKMSKGKPTPAPTYEAHKESLTLRLWAELKKIEASVEVLKELAPTAFALMLEPWLQILEGHPDYESIRREAANIDARRYAERNRLAAQRRIQQKSQAAPDVA